MRVWQADGRLYESAGRGRRYYWSEPMIKDLARMYPRASYEDMSVHFGISIPVIRKKAKELGLQRDREYMLQQATARLMRYKDVPRKGRNKGTIAEYNKSETEEQKALRIERIKAALASPKVKVKLQLRNHKARKDWTEERKKAFSEKMRQIALNRKK